jgi:DNA-binding response OmpR family regulator
MTSKILCVGADENLLRTRCAVLQKNGYDARCSLYPKSADILRTEHFDLIVVSAFLSDEQKRKILEVVNESTPTIVLKGLTLAPDLLALVKDRLGQPSS